ncbi:hypothetical protein CPAST_c25000 [Clostridium pasteurianum DSM 525 = ATCC 6013]|uniref:Uncharacterized protein n=2 Tax=Clostridium pasteurianum TaxID=1501 RepID=A0A0H3J4Y4_CLOPA|nr:hypothetical protein [Clostridium pasteurianum]AJA48569.1 hypothetical protein CPAST_c25000 [Clostridium pasteurianum DSM 525 = ATCC 6013]AJA52557.1 hypothetical protein CLPA_c25000 [Clostridium pasteurianum DSM 525 = ATCC 6013]AOZ75801.1 hypothetical protein AQ983_12145 [Clostridium pasteurianum DSM 525 = ATCC 6013]AOZ79597.1 hypothetical protein AQ984_12140 [Clostridium pasteurianum]ELP57952.1 hypothetical protein F502_17165 [Clostridium pasteurianum DSM 525 = ATCC 6013]
MLKLNKALLSLTTIFFILTFSACTTEEIIKTDKSTKNNSTEVSGKELSADQSGKYKASLGNNIVVDAVVDKPNINNASILQVEDAVFDEKKLCDIFLGSSVVKKEKSPYSTQYSIGGRILDIPFKAPFKVNTPLSKHIDTIVNTLQSGNLNKFKSQELPFMTKEKAIEEARKVLMELSIIPYGSPTVYALDNKTIKQEQERLLREDKAFKDFVDMGKIRLKDNWSNEDDSYYIFFRNSIRSIPCDPFGYAVTNTDIQAEGSEVSILISKNGIQSFFINGTVYREKSVKKSNLPLITISQALISIEKKYSDVILSDKIVVSGISLVYSPVVTNSKGENRNIELIPTWLFNINQRESKGKEETQIYTNVRINAVDGKEIR